MSKGFNLGEYLKGSGPMRASAPTEDGGVSELNTGREELRYLPLDQIDPDPANFYSLEGLDELAANIELIGLQQPLRVRPNGERFVIVSGHRRRAACLLIRDGGNPMFDKGVPCLVDYGEASDAMRELRLIFANSATRVMSSAEQSKQAERVTELLYQLKEQGVEFPGRMRDHVAEACRMSSTKLARLHAIRERLVPELLARFDKGEINESVAYRISREDEAMQARILKDQGEVLEYLTADGIGSFVAHERWLDSTQVTCCEEPDEDGETDCHTSAAALVRNDEDGDDDENNGPDAISGLKKYLDGKSKEDRKFWKLMQEAADSLIERSFSSGAGQNRKKNIDMLRLDCRNSCVAGFAGDYDGSNTGLTLDSLSRNPIKRTWTEVYDALAAIAITRYRQTLVDEKHAKRATARVAPTENIAPAWRTGTPEKTGYYAARLEFYGKPIASPRVLWWDEGVWYNAVGDDIRQHKIDAQIRVGGWWPLPERMEEKEDNDV